MNNKINDTVVTGLETLLATWLRMRLPGMFEMPGICSSVAYNH